MRRFQIKFLAYLRAQRRYRLYFNYLALPSFSDTNKPDGAFMGEGKGLRFRLKAPLRIRMARQYAPIFK